MKVITLMMSSQQCKHPLKGDFLIFLILLLLPIDWFAPTGNLFRELGAKPAILVLVVIAVTAFSTSTLTNNKIPRTICLEFSLILFLSTIGFSINFFINTSHFNYFKNPIVQLFAQSSIFMLFFFAIIFITKYCKNTNRRLRFAQLLPWATGVHLTVYLLQSIGLLDDHENWLSMFRNDGRIIERATGLMSEPSYYGTFAALFGMPLLLMKYFNSRISKAVGLAVLLSALVINAKTMFIVIAFQLFIFNYFIGFDTKKASFWLVIILIIVAAFIVNESQRPLDIENNLSGIMRLGSSVLGLNVALDGNGLIGVGIGQFHFYYRREFSPAFLLISDEAQAQFQITAEHRASTYNLFIRLLVETGFIGLILFVDIIRRALKNAEASADTATQFGVLLISGSVGFLMTQDTYFYPPLALGLALAFSNSKATNK